MKTPDKKNSPDIIPFSAQQDHFVEPDRIAEEDRARVAELLGLSRSAEQLEKKPFGDIPVGTKFLHPEKKVPMVKADDTSAHEWVLIRNAFRDRVGDIEPDLLEPLDPKQEVVILGTDESLEQAA